MSTPDTLQLATFLLDNRLYGVPVIDVQEVVLAQALTDVPKSRKAVAGLLNLRGQIVAAVDLRICLGLPTPADRQRALNVIVRAGGEQISLLVDRMGDVIDVEEADFSPPPDSSEGTACEFVLGAFRLPNQLLLVLDVGRIVSHVVSLHAPG